MNPEKHDDYCWSHHVIEKPGKIRCGECFHWFANERALVVDFNEHVVESPMREATIDDIFFCPHCAHDF